jgi:putative FmdB family regulatory protein
MPTYEYQCPLGHEFELFQKMTDRPRAKCPECGRAAARQISGGAALIFKGSGFYITDYGKDGKGPRKETKETDSKPDPAPAKVEEPAPKASKSDASEKSGAPEKPAKKKKEPS